MTQATRVPATGGTAAGSPAPRGRQHSSKVTVIAWALTLPSLILYIIVQLMPVLQGMRISLTDWQGVGDLNYIGFENYAKVLADQDTRDAIVRTVIYAALGSAGIVGLGLFLAAAVSRGVKWSGFYRVIWFVPGVAPGMATAIFWAQSMAPNTGAVNAILGGLGLGNNHNWLGDKDLALLPILFVTIWGGVGFTFLLLLGSMESVSEEVYEAASLDGSSEMRTFWSITIPLIAPILATVALLAFIGTANNFGVVYAMTQGGPGGATEIIPSLVYRRAFLQGDFGGASALAVMSGLVLMVLGMIGVRMGRSRQEA